MVDEPLVLRHYLQEDVVLRNDGRLEAREGHQETVHGRRLYGLSGAAGNIQ